MTSRNDAPIETLLRLAGERDAPSEAGMQRARAAAIEAWQQGLQDSPSQSPSPARSWRRIAVWAAAAGVAALAVGGAWHWSARPQLAARIAAISGEVSLQGPRTAAPAIDGDVFTRTSIDSGSGRIALAFGASSLRVDRGTRLRIDAPDRVTLLAGEIYMDSGGVNASSPLRIATPAGEVRHIGTQFRVAVAGSTTSVHVREGRVTLQPPGGDAHTVAAGERLEVGDSRAILTRAQETFGAEWEWAAGIAPAFDIENRPLAEFLAWLAREHGWQLSYRDATLQSRAQAVRLHGALDDLDSDAMIERVSLITGIPIALRDGALTVGDAP